MLFSMLQTSTSVAIVSFYKCLGYYVILTSQYSDFLKALKLGYRPAGSISTHRDRSSRSVTCLQQVLTQTCLKTWSETRAGFEKDISNGILA